MWSRVYLKYLAMPTLALWSLLLIGLPSICRTRSSKTPSPISQPTIRKAKPSTIAKSLSSENGTDW